MLVKLKKRETLFTVGEVEDWSNYSRIQNGAFKKYIKPNPSDNSTIPLLICAIRTQHPTAQILAQLCSLSLYS